MYKAIIKPILFLFSPEKAHHLVKGLLKIPGISTFIHLMYSFSNKKLERTVFGLIFPNPVGLAAGFDKDAELYEEMAACGFGFIEVGTITPKAQPGNDKPRLFRLPLDHALINRMGFNNNGVDKMVERLKKRKNFKLIIGGNIGKNKVTPNENAISDYEICFEKLFDYVDYFVVNVSSPNTPNLRELQDKEPLTSLLTRLQALNLQKKKSKPLLLKIAPDLSDSQLNDIISIVKETKISGIVATNTTISRDHLQTPSEHVSSFGAGGLSGKPLTNRSTEVIKYLHMKSGGSFPIIAAGGIHSGEDAKEKLDAGATLVQVYTGFIYEGPGLIKNINKILIKHI